MLEYFKSAAFWLAFAAVLCLLLAVNADAAKKKEKAKAEKKVEQSEPKVFPDWEPIDGACIGLQMPIKLKEGAKLIPIKCCPDLSDLKKEKIPYECELGPWSKDQSRLPKAVEPPKG
jgi:hypothetical protein